jgi:citrate lyase subunit beta/citryl-CoA lyase
MTGKELPLWRSMLFVPANVERFVNTAHTRGADAYILDLEDAIAPSEKESARKLAAAAASTIAAHRVDVLVRINRPWRLGLRDIEQSVGPDVCALVLPKVDDAEHVRAIAEVLDELERERGLTPGHTQLVPMIESAEALPRVVEIASAQDRVVAIVLGAEDFSASAGMAPDPDLLFGPNQQVLLAAHAAGCLPLGVVGSIAEFQDLDRYRQSVVTARRLGARGSFCIHPTQVAVLNEVFSPSPDAVQAARSLVDAYDQAWAEGLGAIVHEGKMIDVPVANRARAVLAAADQIAMKT